MKKMDQRLSQPEVQSSPVIDGYDGVLSGLVAILESARQAAARSVNAVMTSAYWEVGRRIVEHEQGGASRAGYGEALLARLSRDLTQRFGRGFSVDRLETARLFYLAYPSSEISATAPRKSAGRKSATVSRKSQVADQVPRFPLSWSHYVVFVRRIRSAAARGFYEAEALRGGWSVRQLERQVNSQFYERTSMAQ